MQQRRFTVRKGAPADSDGILACLSAAFEPYRASYTPGGFADTILDRTTVMQRIVGMTVFVALSGTTVVGTVGCKQMDAEEGHLRGMAVLPGWQGTGVADALLQAATEDLYSRGCKRVTLDTTEPLRRAVRFYEKHGFTASGRVSDFFGMPLYEYVKSL